MLLQIGESLGIEAIKVFREERFGDVKNSKANIDAAKTVLGYLPLIEFEAGLKYTIDSFKIRN